MFKEYLLFITSYLSLNIIMFKEYLLLLFITYYFLFIFKHNYV